jgi:hypothetical protein
LNKRSQEMAEREVVRAIIADEHANARYYQTLRRFVPNKSAKPEALLDSTGLKEIDAVWLMVNETNKKLRKAYMKLYNTYV